MEVQHHYHALLACSSDQCCHKVEKENQRKAHRFSSLAYWVRETSTPQINHQTPIEQAWADAARSPGGEEVGLDGDVPLGALVLLLLRKRGRRSRLRCRANPGPVR
jgi:hypothetical protein